MSEKLSRKYFEWDFDRFYFFRCSWCSSGNFCCYIFFLSNELLIMLLSWFNLCALEFAWTVVSWERESWCSKWWSFPEAFNKKNFLPQAMWFIFWTKKIFFVDFQSAFNAICWIFYLYRLLSLRYQLLHIHIIHKITKVRKIFSACMCVWKVFQLLLGIFST